MRLREWDDDVAREARIRTLLEAFFIDGGDGKSRGEKTGHLTANHMSERFPALEDELRREQDRLIVLRERRRAALTLERSAALFAVARAILASYARMKAERGVLDFNDQISRSEERRVGKE